MNDDFCKIHEYKKIFCLFFTVFLEKEKKYYQYFQIHINFFYNQLWTIYFLVRTWKKPFNHSLKHDP